MCRGARHLPALRSHAVGCHSDRPWRSGDDSQIFYFFNFLSREWGVGPDNSKCVLGSRDSKKLRRSRASKVAIRAGGLGWPSPATRNRPAGKIAPAPIPATTASSPPCRAARILEPDAARADCTHRSCLLRRGSALGAAAPRGNGAARCGRDPNAQTRPEIKI